MVKRKQKAVGQGQQKREHYPECSGTPQRGIHEKEQLQRPKSYGNSLGVLKYTDMKRCALERWACSQGSQSEYTTIIMHWRGNAPKRGMAPPARPRGSTAVISRNKECICTSSRSMWAVDLSPQHCRCRVPTCSINKVGPESEHQAQELASLFRCAYFLPFG